MDISQYKPLPPSDDLDEKAIQRQKLYQPKSAKDKVTEVTLHLLIHACLNKRQDFIYGEPHYDPLLAESALIGYALAQKLKSLDPEETIIHIEYPGEFNKRQWPELYEIDVWRASHTLRLKQKEFQYHIQEQSRVREEKVIELAKALAKDHGATEEMMEGYMSMARTFVTQRQTALAKHYGVDISMIDKETAKVRVL